MKEFISELLQKSGEIISRYYHENCYSIEQKSNDTPVTAADQEAEKILRAMIKEKFPEHGIIGEEYGNENEDAEYVWVLDPIDGTLAFIHQVPTFTTLIALLHNKKPIWGAIHQPIAQLMCIGNNEEAWCNGKPAKIREPRSIDQSTLLTTDVINNHTLHNGRGFDKLMNEAKLFRTWGDGFGYLLLATGKADIMVDAKMAPWDLLPVVPVVQGAGAKITTWYGKDILSGDSALATHPKIHEKVCQMINP